MKKIRRGISVFNGKSKRSGGHSQWLSNFTGLDYLSFDFGIWKPSYDHYYYEGQHHALVLLFIRVMWGGSPKIDDKE
jgi:hypothetical protein